MRTAFDELKRFDRSLQSIELLSPDVLLCGFAQETQDVTTLMRLAAEQRPIFVRHLAPVQAIIDLSNTEDDIGAMALAIAYLPTFALLQRGQHFAVQTRLLSTEATLAGNNKRTYSSGIVNQLLAGAIEEETGAVKSIKKPQIVVSLLCTVEKGYLGISPVQFNLSDSHGGARYFAQSPQQIIPPECQVIEALEEFAISLPSR